jgi:hypothetical protein
MHDLPEVCGHEELAPNAPKEEAAFEEIGDIDKISDTSIDGNLKTPHVLISLALEENQILDAGACSHWLSSFPALAKYAKVQSVFKSHSTLLLISLPVMIWDLLPENPACSFIGYVCSDNLLVAPVIKEEASIADIKSGMDTTLGSEQKENTQRQLADINLHEAILEEMATATLNEDFRDELSAIEDWLRVLSGAERTAALYAFLQQATGAQIKFLTRVLKQMGQKFPSSILRSVTHSTLDWSAIKAMFPDAVAFIEAETAKVNEQRVPWREPLNTTTPGKSRQNHGVEIVQKPVKMAPNALPLLIVPDVSYKRGGPHDLSPFHSSVAGSIYSNTSSEGPRHDRLWTPSRSTSISTTTDRSTPVSTSQWSPICVSNTPQDCRSPSFESMLEYFEEPHSSPHTATPKMTQQPIGDLSTSRFFHPPHLAADFGSYIKTRNRHVGSPSKGKAMIPSNDTYRASKAKLEPMLPTQGDNHRLIHIFSPHAIGWTVKIQLDSDSDENWMSSKVVEELKLLVQPGKAVQYNPLAGQKWHPEATVQARWCNPSKTPSCQYDSMFYVAPMDGPFEVILGRKLISAFEDDQAQVIPIYDKSLGNQSQRSVRDSGFEEDTFDGERV